MAARNRLMSIFPHQFRSDSSEMKAASSSMNSVSENGPSNDFMASTSAHAHGPALRESLNGRDSSADTTHQGSNLRTASDLKHSSWDFDMADSTAHELSAPRTFSTERTSGNTDGASNWSFAVMDYNELDKSYELPITASRGARWYASTFHCVTAMVGAGVLALPYALAKLGWGWGISGLAICWLATLYSLWQLCFLHERDGKRFNRYHEIGQYCFGRRMGLWIVVPFQLIVMVGLGVVYALTAGQTMRHIWLLLCSKPCRPFGLSAWISVFGAAQILLSQVPNFNALKFLSMISAAMSVTYSTLAIVGSAVHTPVDPIDPPPEWTDEDLIYNAFAALGTLSFAYGGHNVVLEIQATLPSPPSSFPPMMHGVYVAYFIVAYCYFGVAIAGYLKFGNTVADNIMFSIGGPKALPIIADITVIIHMCGSFQIYTMPVFDMIETLMVRKGIMNSGLIRVAYRTLYVVLLCVMGAGIPYFNDVLAVLGAIAYGPTTFLLPSIMFLMLENPGIRNMHFFFSWANISVGLIVTLLGTVGGVRNLSLTFSNNSNYSFT